LLAYPEDDPVFRRRHPMFAFRVAKDTPPPAASARTLSVADVMTTHVYTCGVDDTVEQAARVMAEHACGAVPVLDRTSHVIAMVTDRDICLTALACRRLLSQISVMTAASRRMYAIRTVDTLDLAHELMCKHHVRRLPVVDPDGHLIGIISVSDLVRAARPCGEPGLGDASC
jgi:CBS domain-containing protein